MARSTAVRTPPTLGRVWPLRGVLDLDKTLLVCGVVSALSALAALSAPHVPEPAVAARAARCAPLIDRAAWLSPVEQPLHASTLLACGARP